MSSRYLGGFVGNNFSTSRFGTNSGMFTLGQQLEAASTGTWPGSGYDVILSFTGTGSFEVPVGVDEIAEYAVIAGGAGGGADAGGGGGAGGVRLGAGLPVIAGKKYPVEIGAGGTAGDHPVAPSQGGNGLPSAFRTEANVRYYVSVGDPGAGNKFYYKLFIDEPDSVSNVWPRTLNLYEGSTYVFDQSHPTNAPNHPLRFSTVGAPGSASAYPTGVTTNQPTVGVGTSGSGVMISVADGAPQIFTYCTVHGTGMGSTVETLANVSIKCDGGGGGGAWEAPTARPGGSGGGNGAQAGSTGAPLYNTMGNSFPITTVTAAGETTTSQGFAGGSFDGIGYAGGGGGGAGGRGGNCSGTAPVPRAGNGGNGININITGSSITYAGGGGGGDGPIATSPGGGKGGNAKFFGEFRGGAGDGAHNTVQHGSAPLGGSAVDNTGGGGGGGGITVNGGSGGSGLILIKFKNKVNDANKTIEFLASTSFKNDYGFKEAEYLIVGGGGSGGFGGGGEGGGGAGGVRIGTGLPLVDKEQIIIQVGSGGTAAGPADAAQNGGKGGESSITSTTQSLHIGANGGGRAVSAFPQNYTDTAGGSGGGGRYASKGQPGITLTTSNGHATAFSLSLFGISQSSPFPIQGQRGGDAVGTGGADRKGGGGGGALTAGQAGADVTHPRGGNGGNAISSAITGTTRFYAGGGGGCSGTAAGPLGICSLGGGTGGPLSGDGPGFASSPTYANKGGGGDGYDNKALGSAPTNDGGVNTGGGGGAAHNSATSSANPDGVVSGAGGSGIVVLKITR